MTRIRDLNPNSMPGPGDLWRDPDDDDICPNCGEWVEGCDCGCPEPDYEAMADALWWRRGPGPRL